MGQALSPPFPKDGSTKAGPPFWNVAHSGVLVVWGPGGGRDPPLPGLAEERAPKGLEWVFWQGRVWGAEGSKEGREDFV